MLWRTGRRPIRQKSSFKQSLVFLDTGLTRSETVEYKNECLILSCSLQTSEQLKFSVSGCASIVYMFNVDWFYSTKCTTLNSLRTSINCTKINVTEKQIAVLKMRQNATWIFSSKYCNFLGFTFCVKMLIKNNKCQLIFELPSWRPMEGTKFLYKFSVIFENSILRTFWTSF